MLKLSAPYFQFVSNIKTEEKNENEKWGCKLEIISYEVATRFRYKQNIDLITSI